MATINKINNINYMSSERFNSLESVSENELYAVEDNTLMIYNKLLKIQTKTFDNALWLKILHHNTTAGANWFVSTNASYNIDENKYSILQFIPELRYDSTKYEFLLEYPGVSTEQYNRWTQTSNPLTSNNTITGYTPIHIDWSGSGWGGLAVSSSNTSTYLDGSPGSTGWWYAIGSYTAHPSGSTFPGPNETPVNIVDLWLRVG